MGLLDKLLGRTKKAAGDVMGDFSLRREGGAEERASDREAMAQEERQEAAERPAEREDENSM